MSNRAVKYTAGEIGWLRVVEGFLPQPDALVPREENVKVTLSLSRQPLIAQCDVATKKASIAFDLPQKPPAPPH
jgi:hypothetical protein